MTSTTRTALTESLAGLTDLELHAAAATARVAMWQADSAAVSDMFACVIELIDAELIRRARAALAAFDAAAA